MVNLIDYDEMWMPSEFLEPAKYGVKSVKSCREYCVNRVHGRCDDCVIQECFDLLHAYQTTGLTPDEIRAMDAAYLAKCKEVNALKAYQK